MDFCSFKEIFMELGLEPNAAKEQGVPKLSLEPLFGYGNLSSESSNPTGTRIGPRLELEDWPNQIITRVARLVWPF